MPTALIATAASVAEAARALAEGADLIDVGRCGPDVAAAVRAAYPEATGTTVGAHAVAAAHPEAAGTTVDADAIAAACAGPAGLRHEPPVAAVIAVAAVSTWLGAPAIRSSQVRAVRRAIDMTASIAGTRPPALTIRGLA